MTESACTIRELVGGTMRLPAEELTAVLTDPDSGETLYPQRASSTESLETAIATAWKVHTDGTWFDLPRDERAAALRSLQAELARRTEELGRADSLDSGAPLTVTSAFIGALTVLLEMGAGEIDEGFGHEEQSSSAGPADQWRLPWGPAAVFLPWNAPTITAMSKVAGALVAGCPVILKPSEWAPHFTGPFAEAVQAALPEGVVQIIHGDRAIGASLVSDTRIAAVAYTGGVAGGTAVAEACARQLKPADLELSGNNPVVVLADADLEAVVTEVLGGMTMLNGQYCVGPRRLIVPEDRVEEYRTALATALDAVTIGATTDPASTLGPLSHEQHRQRVEQQLTDLADHGCDVRRHGTLPELSGHFVAPAVVLVDPSADVREEIFGPVLLVQPYRDVDEAITLANDHPYGLSAHVFGDRDAARDVGRRLRAGLVKVNWVMAGPQDISPVASMWGVSGLGTIGAGEGSRFFSGSRFVG